MFSTAFILDSPHCSHTHASWVNQPIYAIGLNTVWYKEPLLMMFSTAFILDSPHCSQTHASWVNQPIYAIGLNTVWYKEPLLMMFSKVVLIALFGFF